MNKRILSVENILKMSQEQLLELYKQGYKLEDTTQKLGCQTCNSTKTLVDINNNVETLNIETLTTTPGSCITEVYQGQTKNIVATINPSMAGIGPYTYKLRDGLYDLGTFSTSSLTHTFTLDFGTLSPGSHNIKVMVSDSCPGGAQITDSACNILVKACPTLEVNMSIL